MNTKKLLLTFYNGFSSVTQVQSIFNEKQPNVLRDYNKNAKIPLTVTNAASTPYFCTEYCH